MEETKIYQQIDSQSFHIGTNADLVPGAIIQPDLKPLFKEDEDRYLNKKINPLSL